MEIREDPMAISSRSSKFIGNKKGTLDRDYQRGDFDERFWTARDIVVGSPQRGGICEVLSRTGSRRGECSSASEETCMR